MNDHDLMRMAPSFYDIMKMAYIKSFDVSWLKENDVNGLEQSGTVSLEQLRVMIFNISWFD